MAHQPYHAMRMAWLMLWIWLSDDEVPVPCLHLLLLTLHPLAAVIMKFPFRSFHPVLVWFRATVMLRFLFHALCFLVPPPFPVHLFAFHLACRRVAVANALLAMLKLDLRLLFTALHEEYPVLDIGTIVCPGIETLVNLTNFSLFWVG
jgi:hypothetical protein